MKLDTTRLHDADRLRVSSGRDVDLAAPDYSNRAICPGSYFRSATPSWPVRQPAQPSVHCSVEAANLVVGPVRAAIEYGLIDNILGVLAACIRLETFSAAAICGGTGPGDTPLDCCPLNSGIIPKIEIATQMDGSLKIFKIGLLVKVNSIRSGFHLAYENYMDCIPSALSHFMDCRRRAV